MPAISLRERGGVRVSVPVLQPGTGSRWGPRGQSFARTMEVLYQGLLGLAVLPESLATLA
jgi:hypothetical protein